MTEQVEEQFKSISQAARGGRVAFSAFLDPDEADELLARLKAAGVGATAWGGFAGARRRVVAGYPTELPPVKPKLVGWYVQGANSGSDLRAAAIRAGLAAGQLGDHREHQDGVTLVTLSPLPKELQKAALPDRLTGVEVPLEHVSAGAAKSIAAVVPSLRVDVLGARAFGVSRAYFAKGVAAGRVRVNGAAAGKAAAASLGDEVYAEGLGRFHVRSVEGETRRGNLKVTLAVEKA